MKIVFICGCIEIGKDGNLYVLDLSINSWHGGIHVYDSANFGLLETYSFDTETSQMERQTHQ